MTLVGCEVRTLSPLGISTIPSNQWHTIISGDGDGDVRIRQDARIVVARLEAGVDLGYTNAPGRGTWLHVAEGDVVVNGSSLTTGDAFATTDALDVEIRANQPTELIRFDLSI